MESASAPEPHLNEECSRYRRQCRIIHGIYFHAITSICSRHFYNCDYCMTWAANAYNLPKPWIDAMLEQ